MDIGEDNLTALSPIAEEMAALRAAKKELRTMMKQKTAGLSDTSIQGQSA